MFQRKTAALCIVALLMATISPAAKADINGQCDPYSALLPVGFFIGLAIRYAIVTAVPLAASTFVVISTERATNELWDNVYDEDEEDSDHTHPPDHTHLPMPDPIDGSEEDESSSKGENSDENQEAPPSGSPDGSGGTSTTGGYGNSCPSPYTWG